MKTPQSPAPVAGRPLTAETVGVSDYAVRLEDHPLVKAGEVHQIVEMFRGGYLGFAKPIGGEWNPKGWRKCDAEGWMPWSGGENPVPGQRVDYRMSNGHVGNGWHADNLRWTNEVPEHRIIAFRLSRPASEQPVRQETTSEHIARDMREGRFPARSEPQMVPSDQPVEAIGAGRETYRVEDCAWRVTYGDSSGALFFLEEEADDSIAEHGGVKERMVLAALSPAFPARTPMGGEVEALRGALNSVADALDAKAKRDRADANSKDATPGGASAITGYLFSAVANEAAAQKIRQALAALQGGGA